MILQSIQRLFRNMKLTNQILIIQAITITIIITILSGLCYILMDQFQQYIKDQLIESVIQKSIISNINLIVGQGMQIFLLSYQQYSYQFYVFIDLFYFQLNNNIQMKEQLEECQHSLLLSSYQFCFNGSNSSDTNQIKEFISLQNQILPFKQDHQNLGFYAMFLDDQYLFAYQVGEQQTQFDPNIYKAYYYMKNYQLPYYLDQIQIEEKSIAYYFTLMPGTKIAFGTSYDQNQQPFIKISRTTSLQFRSFIVLESGYILEDSQYHLTGKYFQNDTGFTPQQFETIVYYAFGQKIMNECESKLQGKILCLKNNTQEKLINSYVITTSAIQIVIFVQDGDKIHQIREDVNKQFEIFFQLQILQVTLSLLGIFTLCLVIQCMLVIRLSRPLQKLVKLAKYNMNSNQFIFQRILRNSNIDKIQRLQDSYYDLVNLRHQQNSKNKYLFQNKQFVHQSGILQLVEQSREVKRIKFDIQNSIK